MTQVYKCTNKEHNDPELTKIITKASLLAMISIFALILNAICTIIAVSTLSIHIKMLNMLLITFDLSTNFWCIVLSYSGYNEMYLKMCGFCDSKCTVYWQKMVWTESERLAGIIKTDQPNHAKNETASEEIDTNRS